MEKAQLKAEKREACGTREARRVRRDGKLPAIIYGHGESPEAVAVSAEDFNYLLTHGTHLIELDLEGSARQVLIKDVQFDHLWEKPIHVDFSRVDLTERVTVSVPLEFKGTPEGAHEGGVLDHTLVDLEVECQVNEIPENILVNVSSMKLGDTLHVGDLELPANMTAVTPEDSIVCSIRHKLAASEEEGEAVAEGEAEGPEIIGEKKEQEESEGE
jgi:large subunit ribosomal protein L25